MVTVSTTQRVLELADAHIVYDVHAPSTRGGDHPPLLLVGQPMTAEGFTQLAAEFMDRTVVTYDPRGLGRSTRSDGSTLHSPQVQAEDLHALIGVVGAGAAVDVFASSGGAVTALELVSRHPADVRALVAHEPPILAVLPDAEHARAAARAVDEAYGQGGFGTGMAAFIQLVSWSGEFTPAFLAQPAPDPAAFGLPTEDDGSRDDPLMSGASAPVTAYEPDLAALAASSARVVIAAGRDSAQAMPGRAALALAQQLGHDPVSFPGGHGGFMRGAHNPDDDPSAFAATLRGLLDA